MSRTAAEPRQEPYLLTREEAASLCRLSPSAFALWVKEGRLPSCLPGTRRWHRDALKVALDRLAGIQGSIVTSTAYDEWKARRGNRKAQGA